MEFIDAYRADNRVILWMREGKENRRLVKDYRVTLYLEKHKLSYQALRRLGLPYFHATHQDYLGKYMPVLGVHISYLNNFEKIVGLIEKETQHKVLLYNADIKPEQQYVYEHGLVLGDVELSYMDLGIIASGDVRKDHNIPVHTLHIDGRQYSGAEEDVLKNLAAALKNKDPDVIFMEHAFSRVPYLLNRASLYGIRLPFHRWDESPLTYRGGKTFFSYGHIVYRDYAVRLHGRLLIDACTHIGSECRLGAIIELAQISGTLLQQVASRSFGAVFQSSLVREMIRKDYLVPFKEKPVDKPLTMFQLLKQDRVGHTLDPLVGFHTDVAEVDYASMYPWLIYHKNISIDANSEKKGIIPRAIKPFLDRRMHYKKTGDKERLQGLKWVLVSSYGYLRFREFKLGVASAHMAIGEAAREVMMDSMQYAQEQGYRVIHGIIDSLYIQKEHITDNDAITFAKDLELRHGIPVSFDGIFKWIVFLPSVTNAKRPVPTHYFGVYRNGKIKVRGIELRQRSVPKVVKRFQKAVLERMAKHDTAEEIISEFPLYCKMLKEVKLTDAHELASSVKISKTSYKHDIPQRRAVLALERRGINPLAGQKISFIYSLRGVVLPEEFNNDPDVDKYRELLIRALFVLLEAFGITKEDIHTQLSGQTTLLENLKLRSIARTVIY